MERWRGGWLSFKQSVLFPTKQILLKITSRMRPKGQGKRQGLLSLYKDMESCQGYEDIQVMWQMIHSSCPPDGHKTQIRKRPSSHWRHCFKAI